MTEQEALARMYAPGQVRPSKPYRNGVIQVLVTSSCDKQCFGCTQASQLRRKPWFMTPEQFGQAVESLRGYFGVVGMFGGNPAIHPQFPELCRILRESWVPKEQRGVWSNNPLTLERAQAMRATFNPAYSNLNVHLDADAFRLFKEGWPESRPFGLDRDSRHSPPWVAMRDVVRKDCERCGGIGVEPGRSYPASVGDEYDPCEACGGAGNVPDESRIWELVSGCDINQRWSAGIGVFRGELRAWFCEVAMAQAILHQDEPDYPDTGIDLFTYTSPNDRRPWWQLPMAHFSHQVRRHCFDCGVPLRGWGELAQAEEGKEQTSATHAALFQPKRKGRPVEVVTQLHQLGIGRIARSTDYLQNGAK